MKINSKSIIYFILAVVVFFAGSVFMNGTCPWSSVFSCGWDILFGLMSFMAGVIFLALSIVNIFIKKSVSVNDGDISKSGRLLRGDISLWAMVLGIVLFFGAPYLAALNYNDNAFPFYSTGFFLFALSIPGVLRKFFSQAPK